MQEQQEGMKKGGTTEGRHEEMSQVSSQPAHI